MNRAAILIFYNLFFPVIAVRVVTTCMFSSESNSGICTLLSQFIMTWAASRTSCQLCEIDKNSSQLPLIILILIVMTFRTLSHTFLRKSGWRAMNVGGYRWHTHSVACYFQASLPHRCPKCKKRVDAIKKIDIWKLPPATWFERRWEMSESMPTMCICSGRWLWTNLNQCEPQSSWLPRS